MCFRSPITLVVFTPLKRILTFPFFMTKKVYSLALSTLVSTDFRNYFLTRLKQVCTWCNRGSTDLKAPLNWDEMPCCLVLQNTHSIMVALNNFVSLLIICREIQQSLHNWTKISSDYMSIRVYGPIQLLKCVESFNILKSRVSVGVASRHFRDRPKQQVCARWHLHLVCLLSLKLSLNA